MDEQAKLARRKEILEAALGLLEEGEHQLGLMLTHALESADSAAAISERPSQRDSRMHRSSTWG